MQAQVGDRRVLRPLIQVVQAKSGQRGQVTQVVRSPGVVGQVLKGLGWGAQRVFAQRVMVQSGRLAAGFEKFLQQQRSNMSSSRERDF